MRFPRCHALGTLALLVLALTLVACSEPTPTPTVTPTPAPTYLNEEIPACTPAPGSNIDPCELDVEWINVTNKDADPSRLAHGDGFLTEGLLDVKYYLGFGRSLALETHVVLRGTYLPGTVRCTTGQQLHPPDYKPGDFWYLIHARILRCYADVRVNSYEVGSGPSILTVMTTHWVYWDGYEGNLAPDIENESEREYVERMRLSEERHLMEEGNIAGREAILFIGPAVDTGIEAWDIKSTWDVQRREDGSVVAVNPTRDRWREYRTGEYQIYRSQLEMELPRFREAVRAANEPRVAASKRRTLPKLVTDANLLRPFYVEIGAYDDSSKPPAKPPPVPECANAEAVANPNNRGLVYDCKALLAAKDTLRGRAPLNWSKDLDITSWDGVTISGTPRRVTELNLSDEGLSGAVPPELGRLFNLARLDLSSNSLTGSIPEALGWIFGLDLRLSGNSLTGCIPVALKDGANDLASLDLSLYCALAALGSVTAGMPTKSSVALSWDTVSGAMRYRVEYRPNRSREWVTDDDTVVGTSHTVDELQCGKWYDFRVSAYGDGKVYAEAWSEPTPVQEATVECTDPTPTSP